MTRHIRHIITLFLLLLAGVPAVWGQGYFTLTNGHYYWFDGNDCSSDDGKYLTAWDQANGWKGIRQLGTHATAHVTEVVEQGNTYLALDTTTPEHPTIQSLPTDDGFSPLCVWFRTGNTGHYYQEWNGYRYYLVATHNEGLSVYRVEVGMPLAKQTTWYNWDHGAAIQEEIEIPGGKKTSYFWMMYDTLNDVTGGSATPQWRMSEVSCYQRPEEMILNHYRADGAGGNTWDGKGNGNTNGISYYDNVGVPADAPLKNYPAGVGATFMPVTVEDHPVEITHMSAGHGLQTVTSSKGDIGYEETIEITASVVTNMSNQVGATYTPPYTEYTEEKYRCGVNLNAGSRTDTAFGSAGIPTTKKWYFYNDSRNDAAPRQLSAPTTVDHIVFDINPQAKRYLSLGEVTLNPEDVSVPEIVCDSMECWEPCPDRDTVYDEYGGYDWYSGGYLYFCYWPRNTIHNDYHVTLNCHDIPMSPVTATITATVFYANGTSEEKSTTITIKYEKQSRPLVSQKAPTIKGSVFGGGKMANVAGNTHVTVHNADSIYAVYGGNDIAGWVQGDSGATVQIGTTQTTKEHGVRVGWVYGGGCGYYHYGGAYDTSTGNFAAPNVKTTTVAPGQRWFNGGVYSWDKPDSAVIDGEKYVFGYTNFTVSEDDGNYAPSDKLGGTIPFIKKAKVSIGVPERIGHSDSLGHNAHEHNDYVLIDSLFGGAENAFVGLSSSDTHTVAEVDINGGTILAVFGGNNYGGELGAKSKTFTTVYCTKMTDDESYRENSYFHGAGRDYGIRHLFGGGNRVNSTHASVAFKGGQVDTAFVGGNSATVLNPEGIVEAMRDGVVYDCHGVAQGHEGFTSPFINGHFVYTNPTLADTTYAGLRLKEGYTDADGFHPYVPDNGMYNVRFLFGGNNRADMDNVSFVKLHSGGVCGVYGGGNMGDMSNDEDMMTALATHRDFLGDLSELAVTMNTILGKSRLVSTPKKISAVIAANESSRIIADYVHGGCRRANVKNSCGVYLAGGSYYDVFAGNDVSGDIGSESDGATYCVITGDAVVHANVYGGSDGYYHCEARDADGAFTGRYSDGNLGMDQFNSEFDYDPFGEMVGLLLPTLQHSNVFVNGGLIKGDLVAGGVMANVGFPNSGTPRYQPSNGPERDLGVSRLTGTVHLEVAGDAEIQGNVFGGGAFASVYGLSQVYVHGQPTILGSLFAGNDCLGHVETFLPYQGDMENDTLPNSYFDYYFSEVYGGSDNIPATHADSLAYYTAHPLTDAQKLQAESANRAAQLSSNGDSLNFYTNTVEGVKQYNPQYSTYVLIEGTPIINSVYGSGNGAWDYDGTMPQFPSVYVCDGREGDRPNQESAYIDIHTSGGFIDTVFGGGNGCTVQEDVVVLVNNKSLDNPAYPDLDDTKFAHFVGGTERSGFVGKNFVGTIFGGNNFSDMHTVPEIKLVQGNVKNIYGGGNTGDMTAFKNCYDIGGNEVDNVSTHIISESDKVTVTDTVFGGCRMSNIEGSAYVEVKKTSAAGIHILYGGNDISGNVGGHTRIDMANGIVDRIYGGSNGAYDYIPVDFGVYRVYRYGEYNSDYPEEGLIAVAGRPDVDSTHVNLWGGTLLSSVFTGGSMSNTRTTCLVVDDQVGYPGTGDVTVKGTLYGGGEGRWDDLNARDHEGNRWGNITGSTHVHLHHAKDVSDATAYGGGGGGDVQDTYLKTYDSWDNPFRAIYGGCWGSEVFGTARMEFNGVDLVKNLYGGNDFTGNVYRTEVVINSGRFHNVFGGGNGSYDDSYYTSQHAAALLPDYAYMNARPNAYEGNKKIDRPNSEYIHITFNDGDVDSCLYGGGRMGTVLPYKKDPSTREYIYEMVDTGATDKLSRYQPDTTRSMNQAFADPEELSYVVLNIHGGNFHRNVFGGGRGFKGDKKPLVYGVKVVNMDGGEVYESLYGGSEFVNDGYPAECKAPTASNPTRGQRLGETTMRPSSIVNFTGGTVGANLYGAGYQGIVHGSTYVNIGLEAIDSCTVWRNSYAADYDSSYIMFKPGFRGKLTRGTQAKSGTETVNIVSHSDALKAGEVTFKNSLYTGANWGNTSSSGGDGSLNGTGFVGGESRMYIDGNGYNTINDRLSSDPQMNIKRSLYGSGTSVLGGDIHSHIELRNYGGMEHCYPTKTIETIQRTDSLWLHNSAIRITGTTDASHQYMSNRYAMKDIGYLNYRGYNVTEYQAAVSNVANLAFYEQGTAGSETSLHTDNHFDTIEVPVQDINEDIDNSACGDNIDICSKEYMVDRDDPTKRHTLMILDDGVNISIASTESGSTVYGSVTGFGFVTAPGGFQSTITARPKLKLTGGNDEQYNSADGGFVISCQDSNQTKQTSNSFSNVNLPWINDHALDATDELTYTNHATANGAGFVSDVKKYREWKVGDKQGLRQTEATLLAHTNPAKLNQDMSLDILSGASPNQERRKTGVAEAEFTLPATSAGHYYKLMPTGFEMSGKNGIYLVDSAWHPSLSDLYANGGNVNMSTALKDIGYWYATGHNNPDDRGEWTSIPDGVASEMEGSVQIHRTPQNTFGLIMMPNTDFVTTGSGATLDFDMPYRRDADGHLVDANGNTVASEDDAVKHGTEEAYFVIQGNARVNSVNNYCSPKVRDDNTNPELKPSMRLYLTYDTTFSTTFTGSVTFKMMEYDENGNEVAPILVKIYIQTIIDSFKDVEQEVLAMYNAGRTNIFTRKIELPPCGEERNLYIKSIKWLPTDVNGGDINDGHMASFTQNDRFSLLGDSSKVLEITSDYPHEPEAAHPGNNIHRSHNRFALTLHPSNNVSDDASMANGWIRGTEKRTNLYKLAYPTGTDAVKTCEWDDVVDTVATIKQANWNGNDEMGYFVGTLDGRGSAVLDVELTFDGTRVYDKLSGKGYVGKAVLTMESFSDDGDTSRGEFKVTIYVKTREHGDTIYLASAASVTRQLDATNSVTVWPYNDAVNNVGHYPNGVADFTKEQIGKTPSLYVRNFRKALEDGIYQEGDVIAIIDEVTIGQYDIPVHLTGPSGSPIEVVRYDGHHHELPDEQSVYRGPMIVVSGGNTFTAENIAFHGGAGAQIKKLVRSSDGINPASLDNPNYDSYPLLLTSGGELQFVNTTYNENQWNEKTVDKNPDTNMAVAPIIVAMGNDTKVNLREGTFVQHNWNGYGSATGQTDDDGMPAQSSNMGAISVTNGATLTLNGNITVENNFSHTMRDLDNLAEHDSVSVEKAPGGAAIYVDSGTVELTESNRYTAVTITHNYLMDPAVHTTGAKWWSVYEVEGVPERWYIDTNVVKNYHKANVLLTREASTDQTGYYYQAMNDSQSDLIVVSGTVGDSTKIGVRKWFPGIHERDTIQFATVEGGNITLLSYAVDNGSFLSDDHFRVFFNPAVDITTAYFFRCASFRHQRMEDIYVGPVYNLDNALTLASDNVLRFADRDNPCPAGGDSIFYRVQGGLMPYTFTWTDRNESVTLQENKSAYTDAQVQHDLQNTSLDPEDRYAKYAASMADTLLLPNADIDPQQYSHKWFNLRVTAVDATGECELYKDIDVRVMMDNTIKDAVTYWPKSSPADDTTSHRDNATPWQNDVADHDMSDTVGSGWSDTASTVPAIASRNFTGVHIEPMVWVDRSQGTISAAIVGEKNDRVYQWTADAGGDTVHELTNVNLCPGDTIFLYTEPRTDATPKPNFIMWDFDPYYRQLARYIVPPHDATVTAYYGPKNYWHEFVDEADKAGAVYDDGFVYSERPTVSNYTSTDGSHLAGFVNTYNGDVHIYDENGLAWFISRVNGLNGQQARSFRFNRVIIHAKEDGTAYDMKAHLWTPIGTQQHPFMGRLFAVDNADSVTADLPWYFDENGDTVFYGPVVIKNIIVNEPNMYSAGFIGCMDSAGIYNLAIHGELVRGSQYVGGLAGISSHSYVRRSSVKSDTEDSVFYSEGGIPTTILVTHYASGGMLGKSEKDTVSRSEVAVKFVGDAVYSGGGIGYGNESVIQDVMGYNFSRQSGLYLGGMAGYLDGTAPADIPEVEGASSPSFFSRLFGRKGGRKNGASSKVQNNYFRINSDGGSQRLGGVVGYAKNTLIENNYIYGELNAGHVGGVTALADQGTYANHNYYDAKSASQATYRRQGDANLGHSADFTGSGNAVNISSPAYGTTNLTLALNRWVRERNAQGGNFQTWRSDLADVNSGYPIFGALDLIPIVSSDTVEGCDMVVVAGISYVHDTVLTFSVVDSVEMVDSTHSTYVRIHYAAVTALSDTGIVGEPYSGYGFYLSPIETAFIRSALDSLAETELVLHDTLSTAYGCDSVITLTITFRRGEEAPEVIAVTSIKVYPNPTTSLVNVEAEGMSHVEVYDNEGRTLQNRDADGHKVSVDLRSYPAGVYFIRIYTQDKVTIQKVIKR